MAEHEITFPGGEEPNPGEKVLCEVFSDRAIYWRDHALIALVGTALVVTVLWLMDNAFILIGALGAAAAIAVRGLYLASEQLSARWILTNQRLIGPGGRVVMLLELENVRRLFGDVQLITRGGDKHLIKHVADAAALVSWIEDAREKRRKRNRA